MKVVFDTNIFISAFVVKVGKPAQILKQIKKYTLLISQEILLELERVFTYPHIVKRYSVRKKLVASYVKQIRKISTSISTKTNVSVIKDDPDDDKFIACALEGKATYIVSGDPHLIKLKIYKGIRILKPAEFLELLNAIP